MPQTLPLGRRISTAARWPIGVALTSWRYMWRTVPMHRSEDEGDPQTDAPPELPAGVALDEVQRPEEGAGPLFHRCYRARIRDSSLTAEELLSRVAEDPDRVAPSEFASFVKLQGPEGEMRVGDEYRVRMPGPWDGPVLVVERRPTRFRLATLRGHLEAGQIAFSARPEAGMLVFEIESWARSASPIVNLIYHRLGMAKEIQLHMWTSVCERVVKLTGGRMPAGVDIHTVIAG